MPLETYQFWRRVHAEMPFGPAVLMQMLSRVCATTAASGGAAVKEKQFTYGDFLSRFFKPAKRRRKRNKRKGG